MRVKALAAALVTLLILACGAWTSTLVASRAASLAPAGGTASYATPLPHRSDSPFRVYLPRWLPSGFRQVHDPDRARYPETAAKFFMRRYGARGRWVSIFEGPAGCCLDSVPSHRVGPTQLSGGRVAYFSNQGKRFGGLYLFWDQEHTHIAINSPNLSKQILLHIARSEAPTSIVHPLMATTLVLVSGTHAVFGMSASRTRATTCWAPPEPDRTITVSCFTPSHLAQLEHRMPSLIDPSVAVRRTTRLSLTDAILLTRHGCPLLASLLYGDLKFSRPPFPSPARYLGVDEFPDGRYRAYAHRLAILRLVGGGVQVEGYVPIRNLSFRVSAAAPIATLRQIALAIERIGSQAGSVARVFPPSVYPKPAKFPPWGIGEGCASLSGVQIPGPGAARAAFPTLARFGHDSLDADLHLSDRALWPRIRRAWQQGPPNPGAVLRWSNVVQSGPAARSPYAGLVRHNCGSTIVSRSIWFAVCGGTGFCGPALTEHYFLLERHGRWLVWFQYP